MLLNTRMIEEESPDFVLGAPTASDVMHSSWLNLYMYNNV
jgi:hypothetical protein